MLSDSDKIKRLEQEIIKLSKRLLLADANIRKLKSTIQRVEQRVYEQQKKF